MHDEDEVGFGDVETVKQGRTRPAPGASAPRLFVLRDGSAELVELPPSGDAIVGRAPGCLVRIDSAAISRRHAALHVADVSTIEDLGSANGTYLRGLRLTPNVPAELRPGDTIEVGDATLVVAVERATNEGAASTGIVVEAPAMLALHGLLARVAQGSISVLVLGETGVGKEIIAETIHQRSPRAERPFVKLNCAALSESLIESELFGYEKGAFTGAVRAKPGLLETANGGTVFLDEVGEMPLATQAKLLRVVEERKVLRVGGLEPRAIDVRIVSATNRDLEAEIDAGRFREDLYFRLNGIAVTVPPLRERVEEIPSLARLFAAKSAARDGLPQPPVIADAALACLVRHRWRGNIRELRNVVERAVVLAGGDAILPEHLPPELRASRDAPPPR
ncbi:sigma 54-interacting transcriptional regulator, partial [Myxococcota bacterium]|nr:sigma 54-interacting transcriptional regulator [Myxococcota bacterium]